MVVGGGSFGKAIGLNKSVSVLINKKRPEPLYLSAVGRLKKLAPANPEESSLQTPSLTALTTSLPASEGVRKPYTSC